MKRLNQIPLIIAAIGVLSPLLRINLGDLSSITNINITLGLLNFGFKGTLTAIVLLGLILHILYLNEEILEKFSKFFTLAALIISIFVFYKVHSSFNELSSGFGFAIKFIGNAITYSWGWLVLFGGLIAELLRQAFLKRECIMCKIKGMKKQTVENTTTSEMKEETKEENTNN